MLRKTPFQKIELPAEAQYAIYRSLRERARILQPDKGETAALNIPQGINLYRCKWSDSALQAELKWLKVYGELSAARTHTDPDFLLPPAQVFDTAESLLQEFKSNGLMPPPAITLDGDGNLYLEWESSDKRLSICFSGETAGSYIYVGAGRDYEAHALTTNNLREAIVSFLA